MNINIKAILGLAATGLLTSVFLKCIYNKGMAYYLIKYINNKSTNNLNSFKKLNEQEVISGSIYKYIRPSIEINIDTNLVYRLNKINSDWSLFNHRDHENLNSYIINNIPHLCRTEVKLYKDIMNKLIDYNCKIITNHILTKYTIDDKTPSKNYRLDDKDKIYQKALLSAIENNKLE